MGQTLIFEEIVFKNFPKLTENIVTDSNIAVNLKNFPKLMENIVTDPKTAVNLK